MGMLYRGFNKAEISGAKLEIPVLPKVKVSYDQRKLRTQESLQMFQFMLNV